MTDELIERLSFTAVLLIAGGFMIAVLSWAAAPAGGDEAGREDDEHRAFRDRYPGLRDRVGKWTRHEI
jgi:hypothetical protein